MKKVSLKTAGLLVLLTSAVACANRGSTDVVGSDPVMTKTEKVAERRGDHVVSKIKFDKGSRDLSADAKAELERAISSARANGEIDDVTVVVWSDLEYPGKGKKLSSTQVKLAEDRGEQIEDYLSEDLDISSYRVGVHNMGEKPNFLSEFFQTADADLKERLQSEGLAPTPGTISGQASNALIFIKLKE